jgi:hypothetical protein
VVHLLWDAWSRIANTIDIVQRYEARRKDKMSKKYIWCPFGSGSCHKRNDGIPNPKCGECFVVGRLRRDLLKFAYDDIELPTFFSSTCHAEEIVDDVGEAKKFCEKHGVVW